MTFKITLTDTHGNTQTVTRGVGSHQVPVTFTDETAARQFCADMESVNAAFKFAPTPVK